MAHLFWDFETGKLAKLDPLIRVDLAQAFSKELDIPISHHIPGFENAYVEIESDDPCQYSPIWKDGMIPRAGMIQRVAIRHLTYKDQAYYDKINKIAEKILLPEINKI